VIDFGGMAVGDPAYDLTIAWTLFKSESRKIFHKNLDLDDDTWNRARGRALWKAAIELVKPRSVISQKILMTVIRNQPFILKYSSYVFAS
jgi:aminoglycoside phosphotransferase (APT) family kinase protein